MPIRNDIIRWLEQSIPSFLDNAQSQTAFMNRASLEANLEQQITFGGNASQFCPLLVRALSDYGRMRDGRYALDAVLEAAKDLVGLEKQAECERLLTTLHEFRRTPGFVIFQSKQSEPSGDGMIFLSYVCEGNDQSLPRPQRQWIEQFTTDCASQLSLEIQHHKTNQKPDNPDTLVMLERAAVVLLLVTQEYLTSVWCQQDSVFLEKLRLRIENHQTLLFIIEREQIAPEERPALFENAQGYYRFWGTEQQGFQPEDLSYATVFGDIKKQLQTLKASDGGLANGATTVAEPRATILLAEVTDDLYHRREEVKRYLTQRQMRILPEAYYPLEPKAFQEAVRQDLEQSQLFVQLLSDIPFKKTPDLPQGRVRCQYELAVEMKKPVLQWRSSELDLKGIPDPEQRDFLQQETVFAVGIEEFKDEILRRAAPPKVPPKNTLPFLLVRWENRDTDLMDELFEELKKFSDIRFACPPYSEKKTRLTLKLLRSSDGLIILYGKVSPDWVHEQYEELLEIREMPFVAQGIYEGPPQKKDRLPFHDPNLYILNCRDCIKEEELRRFVRLLQGGAV